MLLPEVFIVERVLAGIEMIFFSVQFMNIQSQGKKKDQFKNQLQSFTCALENRALPKAAGDSYKVNNVSACILQAINIYGY